MATMAQFVPTEVPLDLDVPQREAAFFYGLFLRGHSPEQLRRDIEVPPAVLAKWHREDVTQLRVALRFTVPFGQDCGRNFDIPAQLLRGMAAQEQAVEKSGFPLRKVKIVDDFDGSELWHRGHGENAVYSKTCRRQVGLTVSCRVPGNSPLSLIQQPAAD